MKFEKITTSIITLGVLALVFAQYKPVTKFFGGGYGLTSQDCDIVSTQSIEVGPRTDDGENVILASKGQRTWARIQTTSTSTVPVFLSFGTGNAKVGQGIWISAIGAPGTTGTTTPSYVDVGRNTDFAYTGSVQGIGDGAATTSVLVTDCKY